MKASGIKLQCTLWGRVIPFPVCLDSWMTIMLEICNKNDNIFFMPSLNALFCVALKLTEVHEKLEVVSG